MADNVTLNAGSGGSILATDDIASAHYQKILVGFGADGTWTRVTASAGFPVQVVTSIVPGTAATNLGKAEDAAHSTGDTGVYVLAVRDDSLAAHSGTDGDYESLHTNASGALWTAISGDALTALQLIDDAIYTEADTDATITGIPMLMEGPANALVPAQGTSAGGLLVNLGTNNDVTVSGSVTADLGANNDVTVSGSVTANAGTNLDTSALALESGGNLASAVTALQIMDDWDESDRAKVNVIAGQAGIAGGTGVDGATVPRVTLATDVGLPAGTNTTGGTISQPSITTVYDGTTAVTLARASGLAASGTTAIVAASVGKKVRIFAFAAFATSATVTNIYLATTTDTDVLGNAGNPIPVAVDADGDNVAGFVLPWNPGGWTETSTANEALNLVLSAAQGVIYAITYALVD